MHPQNSSNHSPNTLKCSYSTPDWRERIHRGKTCFPPKGAHGHEVGRWEGGRTQLRTECTDQPRPARLLRSGPQSSPAETIFLTSAASQKVAFFLQSKLEWKLVRWPIHTFGRLVFLFLGILFTPKVGPAEPFVHRHLPCFPENKT